MGAVHNSERGKPGEIETRREINSSDSVAKPRCEKCKNNWPKIVRLWVDCYFRVCLRQLPKHRAAPALERVITENDNVASILHLSLIHI